MEHEIRELLQGATIAGVTHVIDSECSPPDRLVLTLASGHVVAVGSERLQLAMLPFVDDPLEGPMAELEALRAAGAAAAGVELVDDGPER